MHYLGSKKNQPFHYLNCFQSTNFLAPAYLVTKSDSNETNIHFLHHKLTDGEDYTCISV